MSIFGHIVLRFPCREQLRLRYFELFSRAHVPQDVHEFVSGPFLYQVGSTEIVTPTGYMVNKEVP